MFGWGQPSLLPTTSDIFSTMTFHMVDYEVVLVAKQRSKA